MIRLDLFTAFQVFDCDVSVFGDLKIIAVGIASLLMRRLDVSIEILKIKRIIAYGFKKQYFGIWTPDLVLCDGCIFIDVERASVIGSYRGTSAPDDNFLRTILIDLDFFDELDTITKSESSCVGTGEADGVLEIVVNVNVGRIEDQLSAG